jgi:hypothetical protein
MVTILLMKKELNSFANDSSLILDGMVFFLVLPNFDVFCPLSVMGEFVTYMYLT